MPIMVQKEKCNGCGLCIEACSFGAIKMQGGAAVIDEAICTACGVCLNDCPQEAIADSAQAAQTGMDIKAYTGIMVYAQQEHGALKKVSFELVSEARKLADTLGVKVCALLMGSKLDALPKELINYGADTVFVVDAPQLAEYSTEAYCWAAEQAVNSIKPEIVLIGATAEGRDLAPRLAVRLHTGLTADCTELAVDTEQRLLLQTRPAFGGNIFATIICPDFRPQMATVRPGVMAALQQEGCQGQVEQLKLDFAAMPAVRTQIKEVVRIVADSVALEEAEIIVAGGRGVGSAEEFAVIEQAAKRLGASPGASRAAVDAGWVDHKYQIGQTGKTVAPKIYIACGISGAVQHQAGMAKSGTIIAINRDENALIFNNADYALVGDLHEILPLLAEELAAALEKQD